MDEKAYFIEIRWCDGLIQNTFGREFVPCLPEHAWPIFRVLSKIKTRVLMK